MYSNGVDDVYRAIAGSLSVRAARGQPRCSIATSTSTSRSSPSGRWREVQETKGRWVEEFSRYDAAWSYIGTPFSGTRSTIAPRSRTGSGRTCCAGLPVITDRRPGFYRYDELRRLGVEVELVDSDYDSLREALEDEVATRERRDNARAARAPALVRRDHRAAVGCARGSS